jgi:hypothetical protein
MPLLLVALVPTVMFATYQAAALARKLYHAASVKLRGADALVPLLPARPADLMGDLRFGDAEDSDFDFDAPIELPIRGVAVAAALPPLSPPAPPLPATPRSPSPPQAATPFVFGFITDEAVTQAALDTVLPAQPTPAARRRVMSGSAQRAGGFASQLLRADDVEIPVDVDMDL